MQILDRPSFVTCSFDLLSQCYHLSIVPVGALDGISWDGSTRISPVWPVSWLDSVVEYNPTSLSDHKHICFLGPISPAILYSDLQTELFSKLDVGDVWVGLGYYNLILLLNSDSQIALVEQFCVDRRCSAEFWDISGTSDIADCVCETIEYYSPEPLVGEESGDSTSASADKMLTDGTSAIDAAITQAYHEFSLLFQTSKYRSNYQLRPLHEDVERIRHVLPSLEDLFQYGREKEAERRDPVDTEEEAEATQIRSLHYRDQMLSLNAGLSRRISQALSGTSPVIQTECHFWPHSLLGTAVANLALRNVTEHIIEGANTARYNDVYYARLEKSFGEFVEFESGEVDPTSIKYKFVIDGIIDSGEDTSVELEQVIPVPITYFSARDGFRYGMFTISAPLLSVAGCNSNQWNIGTISHELSHRIVTPKYTDLLSSLHDYVSDLECISINEVCKRSVSTVSEAASILLANVFNTTEAIRIGSEKHERQSDNASVLIISSIRHNSQLIEEILVHIFDYYHFYEQNPNEYVSSIWQSWAVQPSIAAKFTNYVERTAVALAIKHFGSINWAELAIDDFVSAADEENFWHEALYRQRLKTYIIQNRSSLAHKLRRNWALLAIFTMLFRSNKLATIMKREPREIGRAKPLVLYDDAGLAFPRFSNPLKLIRELARDKTANSARSAWLLTLLAFGRLDKT